MSCARPGCNRPRPDETPTRPGGRTKKQLILQYIRQPSTWRGLALILAAAGIAVDPALLEQIGVGVVGAIGLIETLRNERKA